MLACCGRTIDKSELYHGSCAKLETNVYDKRTGLQKLLEEQIFSYLTGKIYHKSLFSENLRMPEKMSFEDLYIMPEIFVKANRIAETPQKLYYYYHNREGNLSSSCSIKHSMSLSIAQRHRYEFACQMTELSESTKSLLLFKAVRASLGAYHRSTFEKVVWKCDRKNIVAFLKKYRQHILHCPMLTIPYKCLALVLSIT